LGIFTSNLFLSYEMRIDICAKTRTDGMRIDIWLPVRKSMRTNVSRCLASSLASVFLVCSIR
jgi:hypothetical protein